MNAIKITGFMFLISFGIFMVVYGGYDDSPGAQVLGVITVVGGAIGALKSRKKNSLTSTS